MSEIRGGVATLSRTGMPGDFDVADPVEMPVSAEVAEKVLEEELDMARKEWAWLSSVHQTRLFDKNIFGKERAIEGYDDAKASYDNLVIEYGRVALKDKLDTLTDETQRNAEVIGYLVEMQDKLNAETDAYVDNRLFRKIGRAANKLLTTGNKAAQFATTTAVVVGASVVGGKVGGMLAGGVVNFIKGFHSEENSGLGQVDKVELTSKIETETAMADAPFSLDQYIAHSQSVVANDFVAKGKERQERNRSAVERGARKARNGVVYGLGVGALVGFGMYGPDALFPATEAHASELASYDNSSVIVGGTHEVSGQVGGVHEISTLSFRDSAGAVDGAHLSNDDVGINLNNHEPTEIIDGADSYKSVGIIEGAHEATGKIEGVHEAAGSVQNAHTSTGEIDGTDGIEADGVQRDFVVEEGRGYIRELMDAAAAEDKTLTVEQATAGDRAIVDLVGNDYIKLHDFSGPDTYSMGDTIYERGISAPSEAASFDSDAIPLINDLIDNGEIDGSYSADSVGAELAPERASVDTLPSIDHAEGINAVASDHYGFEPTHEQSIEIGAELEKDGYAYYSDYLNSTYGNPYGLNTDGPMDTGINAIFEDMAKDGKIDGEYLTKSEWAKFDNVLEAAARHDNLADISSHDPILMDGIGVELKGLKYPDGTDVVSFDKYTGHWSFNNSNDLLPQRVLGQIYKYLSSHDVAAERMTRLAKVL